METLLQRFRDLFVATAAEKTMAAYKASFKNGFALMKRDQERVRVNTSSTIV